MAKFFEKATDSLLRLAGKTVTSPKAQALVLAGLMAWPSVAGASARYAYQPNQTNDSNLEAVVVFTNQAQANKYGPAPATGPGGDGSILKKAELLTYGDSAISYREVGPEKRQKGEFATYYDFNDGEPPLLVGVEYEKDQKQGGYEYLRVMHLSADPHDQNSYGAFEKVGTKERQCLFERTREAIKRGQQEFMQMKAQGAQQQYGGGYDTGNGGVERNLRGDGYGRGAPAVQPGVVQDGPYATKITTSDGTVYRFDVSGTPKLGIITTVKGGSLPPQGLKVSHAYEYYATGGDYIPEQTRAPASTTAQQAQMVIAQRLISLPQGGDPLAKQKFVENLIAYVAVKAAAETNKKGEAVLYNPMFGNAYVLGEIESSQGSYNGRSTIFNGKMCALTEEQLTDLKRDVGSGYDSPEKIGAVIDHFYRKMLDSAAPVFGAQNQFNQNFAPPPPSSSSPYGYTSDGKTVKPTSRAAASYDNTPASPSGGRYEPQNTRSTLKTTGAQTAAKGKNEQTGPYDEAGNGRNYGDLQNIPGSFEDPRGVPQGRTNSIHQLKR